MCDCALLMAWPMRRGPSARPVFVIGGAEDRSTLPSEIRQMAAAAHTSGERLWLVPGADHNAVDSRNIGLAFFPSLSQHWATPEAAQLKRAGACWSLDWRDA